MKSMQILRLISIIQFFATLLAIAFPARAQKNPPYLNVNEHKVDSLYNLLTLDQQIDLLMISDQKSWENSDSLSSFAGGVLYKDISRNLEINENPFAPLLIYNPDNYLNFIGIESIPSSALEAVNEPHLFFDLGTALAKRCKWLGFHAIISGDENMDVKDDIANWRAMETGAGIMAGKVLSQHSMKILPFEDSISVDTFFAGDKLLLFKVPYEKKAFFHETIKQALKEGMLTRSQIKYLVKKVIAASIRAQNIADQPVEEFSYSDTAAVRLLEHDLAAASLTVLKNDRNLIPVRRLAHLKAAAISVGKDFDGIFYEYLNNYTQVDAFTIDRFATNGEIEDLKAKLRNYDMVITALYDSNNDEPESFSDFHHWLNESGKNITVLFADPEPVENHEKFMNSPSLIVAWEGNDLYYSLVPQLIFGGMGTSGNLAFANKKFTRDNRLIINGLGRFSYTLPEAVGMNSKKLEKVDSIVTAAIRTKAIPGCQVLAVRNGKVVFRKAYGFHTYDSLRAVHINDIYDLASVTKVSSAVPCLMKLYDEGKFDLEATLADYLPYFKNSNKGDITFREILAHQAGLKPWIAYWQTTIKKNGKFKRKTLSHNQSENYPYEITGGLYLHKDYRKKIYKQIKKSPMGEKKYLYSGLVFYLFPEIIEKLSGQSYTDYLYENFYYPLGATTLTYNPLERFELDRIVPTEYDSLFRKGQIHGKVHDEGAAMMRGISSNAGLFADADDLAKLFQMYCSYGLYGCREFVSEQTVKEFARYQYPDNDNRRGLGFDKPMPEPTTDGNAAVSASPLSFGHSGFTGTFAWADPEYNLVYIFLSNRVYPTRANRQLYDLNIRTNIQEVFYEAMK